MGRKEGEVFPTSLKRCSGECSSYCQRKEYINNKSLCINVFRIRKIVRILKKNLLKLDLNIAEINL